jgi:hypothetical protein
MIYSNFKKKLKTELKKEIKLKVVLGDINIVSYSMT